MTAPEELDWIVVGAGSSGGVIAARATESGRLRVLLIEAGPDYPIEIPKDLKNGTRNSVVRHDWGYGHVPTTGQRIPFVFPRGRVVGGSSAVNTCIALRGRPYDYDEWDLPDWRWSECLPAFKRLENDLDFDNEWHGNDGPIPIRRHGRDELVPWQAGFLDACKMQAIPDCPDHNDPSQAGAGPHAMNKIGGERMSVLRCYFTREVRRRRNLLIQDRTLVRRVLFHDRRVRGVEVERDGVVSEIACGRVMLCAGAINTPHILLRSGVGPRERVERLGVDLVRDVPAVAARLLDHHGAAIFFVPGLGVVDLDDPFIQVLYRFTSDGSEYPNDMQIQAGSLMPFPWITVPVVTLMSVVGKPRGYGEVHYDTLFGKPRIASHVLEDRDDRRRAVAALRRAYAIYDGGPMRSLAKLLWPRRKRLLDDDDWVFSACDSGYHPCGTVPMGDDARERSGRAACDSRGRVFGTDGLYVADASVFPTVPSANTNLTAIMLGERFGDWMASGALSR